MNLYEVLKASKTNRFPDYWTLLWGRKLSAKMIKTLTGTLPLTFTTHTAGNADDWSVEGNNNIGKNLFQITEQGGTVYDIKYTPDVDAGTATLSGTCSSTTYGIYPFGYVTFLEDTYVYLSGGADGGSNDKYYLYAYDLTASARPKKWDGTSTSESVYDSQTSQEILCPAGHNIRIAALVRANITVNNIVFKPMLRLPDTSADFEPYQIGVGQRTKNLLEITAAPSTSSGVSYDVNKNEGTIVANNTAQGNSTFQWNFELFAGSYVLSGCLSQGSSSTFGLNVSLLDWSQSWWDYGSGVVINLLETTTVRVRVVIYNGTTVNNLVFKPMIRPADTSADFEPYGYQIPITVSQTGQTITNVDLEQGFTGTNTTKTYEQNKLNATNRLRTPSLVDFDNSVQNNITISNGFEFAIRWYTNGLYTSATGWVSTYTISAGETRSFGLTIRHPDNSDITNAESIMINVERRRDTDIYIGADPLTQGETISKTSTGIDLELFDGENMVDTTLYNKPTMTITYK